MCAADDEETQKRGGVMVACETKYAESIRTTTWRITRLTRIMPIRCAAAHFCFNDAKIKWLLSLAVLAADPRSHARLRQHSGTLITFFVLVKFVHFIIL